MEDGQSAWTPSTKVRDLEEGLGFLASASFCHCSHLESVPVSGICVCVLFSFKYIKSSIKLIFFFLKKNGDILSPGTWAAPAISQGSQQDSEHTMGYTELQSSIPPPSGGSTTGNLTFYWPKGTPALPVWLTYNTQFLTHHLSVPDGPSHRHPFWQISMHYLFKSQTGTEESQGSVLCCWALGLLQVVSFMNYTLVVHMVNCSFRQIRQSSHKPLTHGDQDLAVVSLVSPSCPLTRLWGVGHLSRNDRATNVSWGQETSSTRRVIQGDSFPFCSTCAHLKVISCLHLDRLNHSFSADVLKYSSPY